MLADEHGSMLVSVALQAHIPSKFSGLLVRTAFIDTALVSKRTNTFVLKVMVLMTGLSARIRSLLHQNYVTMPF